MAFPFLAVTAGVLLASAGLAAQTPASATDEAAVRDVVRRYVNARELKDPAAIEALFTVDADQHTTSGEWRRGRAQIVPGTLESSRRNPGTRTITVRVTDNGSPSEGATTTFQLTVGGGEARLTVQLVASLVQVTCSGDTGLNYELQKSSDLVTWEKIVQFTTSYTYIEPAAENAAHRFYRLKLVQ